MEDIASGIDPDDLMDLDEAEGSDLDDEDDELIDDPLPSPFQFPSSGPASTATSAASSPPNNDDFSQPFNFSGKPFNIKRGRGRPRREGGKPVQRRTSLGGKVRRLKPPGYPRGTLKKFKNFDRMEFELSSITPSPSDEMPLIDPETGALIFTERERPVPIFEELPYFPEQWPGKVCAFCNLGERSQLGQSDMIRLICSDGFIPRRIASEPGETSNNSLPTPERESGDKSPRGPVTCRRQKSFNKCRHPSLTSEYVDELSVIGYTEEPHVSALFDSGGYFYTHRSCALWSSDVLKNENNGLENVDLAVLQSSSKKCSYCNHYGASISCKVEECTKNYHFPCATASGAFQVLSSLTLYCTSHIGQVSLHCEDVVCYTCKSLGDIVNLVYCSICGEHYHGLCIGLKQLPGVRAGWQCRKCRTCQVCRVTGDESKLMTCEQCDKIYHSTCQRPIVTTIPKYGWKCRCCRLCTDCGSRTPGAGLSSRWHAHYTVCDSCYQQRNKGYFCPVCHRAYRAHAHREMVQCTSCLKFVHGTCDSDAELVTYQQRKETHPEYEYVCPVCKNLSQPSQLLSKRSSTDDPNECLSTSQESSYDESVDFDLPFPLDSFRNVGLGKGKPYSTSKIAKKRLCLSGVIPGRPKGVGKGIPGKVGFMKRQRMTDFGRKRGSKAKMRGVFGVPGVGLQRPVSDGKNDEEPGIENRLVLCSAKDKFVLTQDICVMCGALGTDQEGCLIACVQCGQCYHPYCVNVRVTKVILEKGWRCLDCTVCEGCGQRNDEGRLLLCDDCDISYHIYCMDPPLDYVPLGNWKCKWCAICQTCGATDPGFNCTWMNSYSECGPCASHVNCPSCSDPYTEGDLIIQCVQCERWLHGACDSIKTEEDAEKCAEGGYNCLLCRPRDVPPPHMVPSATVLKPPTPTKSPEVKSNNHYYMDGVYLSETGHNLIKSLSLEQHGTRKKRKKMPTVQDKEAGIMATIESVVAGSSTDNMLEDGNTKLELVDIKDEPPELYREGMNWNKENGPPPEGFAIITMDNGISVLRRKRQRNLQKLGIGGFLARVRGIRPGQDNDDIDTLPGQSTPTGTDVPIPMATADGEKPRRKPVRRKPKSKLAETFPPYLQEAFFGKELLDSAKEYDASSSDEEKHKPDQDKTIQLTQDEIKAVAAVSAKRELGEHSLVENKNIPVRNSINKAPIIPKVEEEENTEDLKDVLALPGDLLDTELVNTLMNERDSELAKNAGSLEALTDETDLTTTLAGPGSSKDTKDELSDILGSHFSLESMPNINSKDVEDIFKGVLTDDSQESQESNAFPIQNTNTFVGNPPQAITQHPVNVVAPVRPTTLPAVNQGNINSPLNFPPQSPYQSEYSNSPQFSPAFSEPPSPWVSVNDTNELEGAPSGIATTYNQRSSEKMKADEGLGNGATISAVLYANINHPEWKTEFPNWSERCKQILKKWRTLSSDQKAPYLQQARDNRSALRMKKQQQSQMNKDAASTTTAIKTVASSAAVAATVNSIPSTQVPAIVAPVSEDQEKVALQHKSAREAEQERQWKQLQALRQQQAQQQQHVIHEQRVQARVQRQISDPSQSFNQDQNTQELSPVTSPSQPPRQLLNSGLKSPTFTHPGQPALRPPTPSQSPSEFPNENDPYTKPPSTPKPQPSAFQSRLPTDPYTHQPATPRPSFPIQRPTLQGMNTIVRGEGPEINKQLRDLLQRQQFKKLDDQLLAGKGQQRVWPPVETTQEIETPPVANNVTSSGGDATFRHPLPPGINRPRNPVPVSSLTRQGAPLLGLKIQQLDPRMQGLDPRMRPLLQQQQRLLQPGTVTAQQPQQAFIASGTVRFTSGPVRSTGVEYEQLLQRQQQTFQARAMESQITPRLPVNQLPTAQRPSLVQTPIVPNASANTSQTSTANNEQEIPDNVTAELEKLEQESDTMVELQGVSDILGGLGEDDDELLAEVGADFNILEYADTEALPGEKTNILDLELEEEPIKNDKKVKVDVPKSVASQSSTPASQLVKKNIIQPPPSTSVISQPQTLPNSIHPPPLAISQSQTVHQTAAGTTSHLTPQQIHQQMIHQVQQAAALGRPVLPGSKLQTSDGIIRIVTPNNIQLQVPQNYHQRLLVSQLQNQKLQMRVGQSVPRMMSATPTQQGLPAGHVGLNVGPRLGIGVPPPPPPPPYQKPPPPYPGSTTTQQEQPLLLEDLLEQEKREQEKQNQNQVTLNSQPDLTSSASSNVVEPESSALLSDHDFERLKADVFSGSSIGINANSRQGQASQVVWPQNQNRPTPTQTPQPSNESRVQTFNANLLPTPPLPPENIVTEEDKQKQIVYEQWLNHQNNVLSEQQKFYETEVQKLRKIRKSLNSKQRQLRKSGSQLPEADASELQRISAEQAVLQKHLEASRKLCRQHSLLHQEYRNKQQAKQRPGPGQSPLLLQQNPSPLGPPSSSPVHHSAMSQSPMMSPTASPLTQHSSPLHSPSPMVSHSPGPGSVTNILQSPNSIAGNNLSPMQPSPRIGTPHSHGDGSPGPAPSPSQICLPPPAPRMTSPQHKRVVTSPVGYTGEMRPGTPQMRFVRTSIDHTTLQQRVGRLPSPMAGFQQKPNTPSPLSSPPPQQINISQQIIQKHLMQQQNLESQQDLSILNSQRAVQLLQQRNFVRQQLAAQQQQLATQQQLTTQQHLTAQQQQSPQQAASQPQPLTPQQHQMMIQQQQQLAKQQQQQMAHLQAQLQAQQRLSQQQSNPPSSPMPPKSPLVVQQMMSPHSMPASPMPPRSPMMNFANNQQTPNSPVARNFHQTINQPPSSPMAQQQHTHYQQPPSSPMLVGQIQSPMSMRRPPSANSSPAVPDRPTSVESLSAPRTPYSSQHNIDNSLMDNSQSGGGNPNNPNNPIPAPPNFGRFGYFKLGLRGGSPMWNFNRGAKRIPTPSVSSKDSDTPNAGDPSTVKPKKESHLSKVSILKRKSPAKTNLQSLAVSKVGSLVSTDYNEFDDSSCTPPVTPPPIPSTSRLGVQKTVPENKEASQIVVVHSPEEKSIRCEDIMDYDDDNSTVISGEVSLSSAAQQNDGDDIAVMETFSQSDLGDAMSSPLESDHIPDEYVLFQGNMVVDMPGETQYSDKDEEVEDEYSTENMHVVIRSPTTSDDEFIMQNKPKNYNIHQLSSNHISVADAPESPEQEEMHVDRSPETHEEETVGNYEESEIVIIDPSAKSPEEQISTKEDFEELIDERRKEKILKSETVTAKHINEIHKYAASVFSFSQKSEQANTSLTPTSSSTGRITNLITSKLGQKISLITTPVGHNIVTSKSDVSKMNPDHVLTQNAKLINTTSVSKVTNIILHNAVRTNVLNVPKLVTSGSSAITIVSASTSPIGSIIPSAFTVPVISASAVRQLPNVKVIDKPSSSICLPKKIFEDDSVSPDSSNCEDDKSKDSSDEKSKTDSPPADFVKQSSFHKFGENSKNAEISSDSGAQCSRKNESQKPEMSVRNESSKTEELNCSKTNERKVEKSQLTGVKIPDQLSRAPSPVIAKTSTPVIIHNTPELKMTAQIIQETQSGMQITARTETVDGYEGNSGDDTKSVVISIPSPTPSQEQMLDNIALQALEHRRRDGNSISGQFESFEDVLDMIENITGEPPTVLEDNIKDKLMSDVADFKSAEKNNVEQQSENHNQDNKPEPSKPSAVPQLSPLSQPTDLTTNMANASQQLRSLLSSLHTTSATSSNNVETIVKSVNNKVVNSQSTSSATPVVTSKVIQQSPVISTLSTVIVPNKKPVVSSATSPKISPVWTTQVTTNQNQTNASIANNQNIHIVTTGLNFLPSRSTSTGGIHLMPDHPKLPRVTAISSSSLQTSSTTESSTTVRKAAVTTESTTETVTRKPTYSLTEMLQSHPAAVPTTKTSADTITAASLLGSSIGLSRSAFSTSLVQAQPHVVVSPQTSSNTVLQTASFVSIVQTASVTASSGFKPVTSTTNLLHTHLTKVIRSKSMDEVKNELRIEDIKTEPIETTSENKPVVTTLFKQEQSGCKYSSIQTTAITRTEDSQNVLLKKLLQNTACASTQTPSPVSAGVAITVSAPVLLNSANLDNQLKSNTPTLSSILPPCVKETPVTNVQTKAVTMQRTPVMSRETSFVSSPIIQQSQNTSALVPTQQLHIDIRKSVPPNRTSSRDELLSPLTPRSSCSQDSSLQTPPPTIKKEIIQPNQQQNSVTTPQEVKKEFVDETSQHSEISDQSRSDLQMKEEMDSLDSATEKMLQDQKEELKKQKRRMYQQKRRQNQILNKEAVGQPKKRPRKSSKVDEDYDTYMDSVMAQLRSLPPMVVSEPILNRNFNILPVFGSDFGKLSASDYDTRFGELAGEYGNALLPGCSDFYITQPYGDAPSLPEKPPASTQRGFYDQEFPSIKFDADEDKRFDVFCREDTPDFLFTVPSECSFEPSSKFLALKLIDDDDEDDDDDKKEENMAKMRLSPVVPLIAPTPIRLKPAGPYLKDYTDDKENIGREICLKSKFGSTPVAPLKDSGNVTVTLTLTSSAAEDIMGVLRDLANILHIPAPTSYQIVERTTTPPSQKLGLYRTKSKDGKEGVPIDIQSILNGEAKFCKHCDVVILNNMIRKKVSELPFLSKDSELLSDGDELFFCSSTCYMQFALMHRSPSIPEDKAAAIIDHLCHKDKNDLKGRKTSMDSVEQRKHTIENMEMELHYYKKGRDNTDDLKSQSLFMKSLDTNRMRRYTGEPQVYSRVWKGIRYKVWEPGCLQPPVRYKKLTDKEIMELLYRMGITVTPPRMPEDTRKCMFCQGVGDGVADGPARLLNFDVDKWVHLNCGLWSDGVYETVNGALMNLENALQQSLTQMCVQCDKLGATIRCFKTRCSNVYHLACAVKDGCMFYKNKTTYCILHIPKNEKDNELTTLSVSRRVYVNRDENRQVAAVMHHSDTNNLLRVGSLIFLNVGQLLPHQLQNFHTTNYIYPIGYKIIRFYWSMRHLNKRCRYVCSIHEVLGRPEFRILVQEPPEQDFELKDSTPKGVWQPILEQIAAMRRDNQCVQVFPKFLSGEDLFGLTEPAVVRVLESLPGIETLTDYKFKYGRNPLLELPLAINPSGSARTEPKLRNQLHWKRPHTQRTSGGSSQRPLFGPTPSLSTTNTSLEVVCPYSKQFVHSKSSQYKKMKQEWRNNVYLARSKIQGLGLYAARDLEKHTMVIEYIGEIIRSELAETREKKYEARNRGIYMFRLDEDRVVDATLCGGLARYINHSCNPNCVAETVEVDRDYRIIIFAKRRISRGEELAYDYKFDIEDDQHKISCMCGAPNCRKWMN